VLKRPDWIQWIILFYAIGIPVLAVIGFTVWDYLHD